MCSSASPSGAWSRATRWTTRSSPRPGRRSRPRRRRKKSATGRTGRRPRPGLSRRGPAPARNDMRESGRDYGLASCLASTLLILLIAGTESRSQGLVIVREEAVAQPPVEGAGEDEEAGENVRQRVDMAFVMSDDQFDQWVFGGPMNSGAARRNKLESLLTLQVDDVGRVCMLSELQKRKLILAGKGDIKRFLDKVDEKRKKFDKIKSDQNKVGDFYQELQPLQVALNSGLFNEGSLFAKTLKTSLASEQAARYESVVSEKRQYRYRAKVELAV